MNQALLLAAVMLLWLFPNLIFLAAVTGRDFADSISTHMGLNDEATSAVDNLFKTSSSSTAATVGAVAFLVLAVTATVAVIQKIWQTIWGLERLGYWHEIWQQVLWGSERSPRRPHSATCSTRATRCTPSWPDSRASPCFRCSSG